jgi:hypothetical protein
MTQVHDRLITSNSTAAYKPQSKTVRQMVFVRRWLSNELFEEITGSCLGWIVRDPEGGGSSYSFGST